jgi:acyl carrier protein
MDSIRDSIITYLREKAFLEEDTELDDKQSLTDTGIIDSINLLQMIDFLEREFSITIPIEEIIPENFDSLARIETYINKISAKK